MPTIKQKLAYKKVVNGSTITKAMADVGYAKSTAARTNKLTSTKGWQELIDKNISEAKLAKVHSEGLEAVFTDKYNDDAPDYGVRHKYLETGLKLRGKLKEQPDGNTYNTIIYNEAQERRIAERILNQSESAGTPDRLSDSDEPAV